ncbi:MAG: ParB N-terminal domain-containing protein [Gammaproteobacteria bacterium]
MGSIDLLVNQLLLDSVNPRIGHAGNQRDALQKILQDQGDKLFVLADSIVSDGLSPIDRLLVLREKKGTDQFIVLEGNRRLAALKILVNPHVLTSLEIKTSLQKRFVNLAGRFKRTDVEPVACFEVPNRNEGNQWIYLRHTGENEGRGVVGWSSMASSRFRGGDAALQALDFVTNYGNLSDDQKQKIDNTFPITTLDRLLSTRTVRMLIGIEVNEGKLRTVLPTDELMKPLRRMVLDLAGKKVNVSKLKSTSEQIEYVQSFDSASKPDLSKKGALRAVEDIHGTEFKAKHAPQQTKRPAIDPSARKTVVPSRMRLDIEDSKVAAIFKELRGLKIDEFPNAAAVLLRVFLELSVDCYLEAHSIPRRFKSKQNNTVDKPLKQKVKDVIEHLVSKEGCERKDFLGVTHALSVSDSPLYIDLLHAYLHNRFVTPMTRDLTSAWDNAHRFFEKIWP